MYLKPELREAWFPCLGYVGNFILKSSHKTLQIQLCPWNGFDGLCLLCIQEFSCDLIMGTGYSVLRYYSNKGQLAIQCPSEQGAIFHYFGSEVVHLKSKLCAHWVVAICKSSFENFLWSWLIFSKIIPFFQNWTILLDPKRKIFSAHNLTCMILNQKIEQAC